jgi:hypothetical protein
MIEVGVLAVVGGVGDVAAAGVLAYADAGAFVLCSSLHTCQVAAVASGGGGLSFMRRSVAAMVLCCDVVLCFEANVVIACMACAYLFVCVIMKNEAFQ